MRTLTKIMLIPASIYLLFRWDYYLSGYLFDNLCDNDTGVFVYESIEIDPKYFTIIESLEQRNNTGPWFNVNGYALDKDYFNKHYILIQYEKNKISSIGPLKLLKSYVVRKSDKKVLGEAVTGSNGRGWLAQKLGHSFWWRRYQCVP